MSAPISKNRAEIVLRAEIDRFLKGMTHIDNLMASFIYFITEYEDANVMRFSPDPVKKRMSDLLSEFHKEGKFEYFDPHGHLVDDSERLRKLEHLLKK